MDTMTLSSRARTSAKVAAAGITALVATFAVAGSVVATGREAGSADPPRITITSAVTCSADATPAWLDVYYDDHVDGHVPQSAHEELREGSTVVWSADGLYQEHGDYFNTRTFSSSGPMLNPGAAFNPSATYTYAVTITYDDLVTQTQSTTVDLGTACAAAPSTTAPPTTAAPGGTLPQTGSGDQSWILGAIAGLLTTAGAALVAGARRSRID